MTGPAELEQNSTPTSDATRQRLASSGFNQGAIYDAGRPSYTRDAVDYLIRTLDLRESRRVVEIGAGTGKFTEQLLDCGVEIVAVDPSDDMRQVFHDRFSDLEVKKGTGEQIPLDDHSCDAALVAQAFHWFDPRRAMQEISRVLTSEGRLGLIWNERDESVPWVSELSHAMQWDTRQPYRVGTDFSEVVTTNSDFSYVERRQFRFTDELDHSRLRQRVLSTSYISAAPGEERDQIMANVDRVIGTLPARIDMPYLCDAYVCSRSPIDANLSST
jgi:ubiquinone/menaquinone biosynthesis C-methylase UbiE